MSEDRKFLPEGVTRNRPGGFNELKDGETRHPDDWCPADGPMSQGQVEEKSAMEEWREDDDGDDDDGDD